jgi:hypothetical protein
MNDRSWSIWCLLETQWNVAPMGGMLGWGGYDVATHLLITGYGVRGEELLAETERFKLYELAQMEIEIARRKLAKAKEDAKKRGAVNIEGVEHVDGELDDFFEDAVLEDADYEEPAQ